MQKVIFLLLYFGMVLGNERIDELLKNYPTTPEILSSYGFENNNTRLDERIYHDYFFGKEPIVSFENFLHALKEAREMSGLMLAHSDWVDGESPFTEDYFVKPFFDGKFSYEKNPDYYVPFEKALLLKDDETYILIGNLYGGAHTLITMLADYISFDTFQLNDPKTHLVFTGNYINNGLFSVEVLYIIARLFTKNPESIHLLRGGNEIPDMAMTNGLRHELKTKYPGITQSNIDNIVSFFDCMLEALWIRHKNSPNQVTLVTSAGIELGDVNIPLLLESAEKFCFKRVGGINSNQDGNTQTKLYRKTVLNCMDEKLRTQLEKIEKTSYVHTFCDYYPYAPNKGFCSCNSSQKNRNFQIQYHTGNLRLDKFEDDTRAPMELPNNQKSWRYRKLIFDYFVRSLLDTGYMLTKILRGSQHTFGCKDYNIYPMMEKILEGSNLFKLSCRYLGQSDEENKNKEYDYEIITFGPAPDTIYGISQRGTTEFPKHYPGVATYTTMITKNNVEQVTVYERIVPEYFLNLSNQLLQTNNVD